MAKRKILTVTLEFEMGQQTIHGKRIKEAYDALVIAAAEAAEGQLPYGSVEAVRSRATWDYRWYEASSDLVEGDEWDVSEPED
ncbi:hypothetical protein [Streptomyces sp. NBC_01294]|uniref:hypothetical protein n=1 Tax=Streptomyces sp. NBC_01294 TaxID=2903815 RepID=UPI002DDB8190|nr:hypothetical protein [Streptomyces sp. NBC_01294]WRZ59378.1 hypothetical protein OG534_24565 [Streptomyces sp. NBC_01294]